MAMAYLVLLVNFFLFLSFFTFSTRFRLSEAQMVPAIYVFGDSLVDVGNNNYLSLSIAKANLPHYGIDFPTKKPNGRFTNGKNAADLIAEKLGLATSPPYLSLATSLASKFNKHKASFLDGVSFASGGAGIFKGTDERYRQSIPLTKQVDYYSKVYEEMKQELAYSDLQLHLSKSIFAVVIGSNDFFDYFGSSKKNSTPQQFVDSMVFTLKEQLKRIYEFGGRKFMFVGVGAIGCCPSIRVKNKTEECNAEMNYWSVKYNEGLNSMLKEWKMQLKDINYSYFDTYNAMQNLIQNPASYGFAEIKAACCGIGELRAKGPCLPISSYCSNREDHIFWDEYHPTESAYRILVDAIFGGSSKYAFPITIRQLIAV
ncbi:GDSL esterase/lipase [Quillaja saponaria]|uniref:GDSL esterase/lipase n=1 Tax=Quillaja saponaria TaxID=32244 RepID=A0AAD7LVG3_QUISA|nr:GDSL esterase/lipase [Quillaja saponaria]